MALQLILSAIYETVRHSWLVASVAVKYVLAEHVLQLALKDELGIDSFLESVRENSRIAVTGMVAAGFLSMLVDFQPAALLEPVSQFIALAYFAYLFWSY